MSYKRNITIITMQSMIASMILIKGYKKIKQKNYDKRGKESCTNANNFQGECSQ
jgi:hypothetical protein